MELVLATKNKGKIRELTRLLTLSRIVLRPLGDYPDCPVPPEDKVSYAGNAMAKAIAVCASTKIPVLADDSGLEIDILGGRPGIQSARYGGEGLTDLERLQKVLREMREIEWRLRTARFRCTLALVLPDGRKEIVGGECRGIIAFRPWGEGGFGYDPIFFFPGLNRTIAELSPEEKDRMSHRADAARKLLPILQTLSRLPSSTN